MVTERAKISLNEIGFGSTVFAGSTEMLRFWVGNAKATEILYSGNMYPAEEAKNLGLINEIASENNLMKVAYNAASVMASKNPQAFASIKLLLRKRVADEMIRCEEESIEEFVNIWYSEDTWENLKNIKIH
jgi:enoyl-CoA hydratase/carnithine racemase